MGARSVRSGAACAASVVPAVLALTIAGSAGCSVPVASGEPDGTSPSVSVDSPSPTFEVTVPDSSASTSTDSGVSSPADFATGSSTPGSSTPDSSTPDTTTPDASAPDASTSDASTSDVSAPESAPPGITGTAETSASLGSEPSALPAPAEVPAPGDVTAVDGSPKIGGPAPDATPPCQPFWPCWFPPEPTEFVGPALCVTSPPPPDAAPPPPFEFLGEVVAPAFDQERQQWGFWRSGGWVPLYAYEC